ncbi:MAG TPA: hypothetical protein VK665_02020 [Candidatus Elarobacter sp.]|nr:hypothetical protein [Candidatus Elarobacter sp.]
MTFGRSIALGFALLLAAGCSGGSPANTAPPWTPPKPPQPAGLAPQDSPAGRVILANVPTSGVRAPQGHDGDNDADDGDWGTLVLPKLVPCAGGTFATDCGVWLWTNGVPTRTGTPGGQPPALNFCANFTQYPGDLAQPATPLFGLSLYSFALTYAGTKPAPIVGFATRWWNVNFQSGFTGTATSANVQISPALTTAASRGWLVFFTWSWPADVLVVPYAINEIQPVPGTLAIPPNGSARLGAFDCLGRPIAATRSASGFGFSPNLGTASVTSAGPELNATVFGGANPSGFVYLSDDKSARTTVPVVRGGASPTPTPTAVPTTPPTTR